MCQLDTFLLTPREEARIIREYQGQTEKSGGTHMAPKSTVQLMTIGETAEALSISKKTVWKYVYAKRIGSVKLGRSRRIPAQCVQEFVDRGMQPAA